MRATHATSFSMHGRPAGFTLVEVMVSVVIATMILGAASTVFITAMNGWENGGRQEEVQRVARTASSLIERHLRSAVPPTTDYLKVFEGEVLGDEATPGHSLTMISAAQGRFPRDLPPTDVCEVQFELDPETGEGLLMRIDATPDDDPYEGGYLIELSPLIRQFSVIYYDGEEWVEDWYRASLPRAVELTLAIAYPDDEQGEDSRESGLNGGVESDEQLYNYSRLISLPLGGQPSGTGSDMGAEW